MLILLCLNIVFKKYSMHFSQHVPNVYFKNLLLQAHIGTFYDTGSRHFKENFFTVIFKILQRFFRQNFSLV